MKRPSSQAVGSFLVSAVVGAGLTMAILMAVTNGEAFSHNDERQEQKKLAKAAREVFASVEPPASWTAEGKPEIFHSEAKNSYAYSFYSQSFTSNSPEALSEVESTFNANAMVLAHLDEAACSLSREGDEIACEARWEEKNLLLRLTLEYQDEKIRVEGYASQR